MVLRDHFSILICVNFNLQLQNLHKFLFKSSSELILEKSWCDLKEEQFHGFSSENMIDTESIQISEREQFSDFFTIVIFLYNNRILRTNQRMERWFFPFSAANSGTSAMIRTSSVWQTPAKCYSIPKSLIHAMKNFNACKKKDLPNETDHRFRGFQS